MNCIEMILILQSCVTAPKSRTSCRQDQGLHHPSFCDRCNMHHSMGREVWACHGPSSASGIALHCNQHTSWRTLFTTRGERMMPKNALRSYGMSAGTAVRMRHLVACQKVS